MILFENKIKNLSGCRIGNRGQTSLIITFIIMMLLLSAAIYLTSSGVKNFEIASYTAKSSKAFYASESGVETFTYEKNYGTPLFAIDTYITGNILVCGCIDGSNNLIAARAPFPGAASAVCSGCNPDNMRFDVERANNTDNNKVKSTGGYGDIQRAVRIQW